jgi:putative ABC transport system permease protein
VTEGHAFVRDTKAARGRLISSADNDKLRKVAVLGADVATELFGESDPIGKDLRIEGARYQVIGVLAEKNRIFDGNVFVPLNTATNTLIGDKDLNQIVVKVANDQVVDAVALRIEDTLRDYYHTTNPDDDSFTVSTSQDFLSLTQTIVGVFTTLLAGIASISLLVGGIGIMNIMLVSVTERTKEIGLRKAVGAKQSAILGQFLIEATTLTVVGGLVGVLFGAGLGAIVGQLGNIPVQLTLESVLLATSVSAAIGILFGFYPAYRAAKLNPIAALRYE